MHCIIASKTTPSPLCVRLLLLAFALLHTPPSAADAVEPEPGSAAANSIHEPSRESAFPEGLGLPEGLSYSVGALGRTYSDTGWSESSSAPPKISLSWSWGWARYTASAPALSTERAQGGLAETGFHPDLASGWGADLRAARPVSPAGSAPARRIDLKAGISKALPGAHLDISWRRSNSDAAYLVGDQGRGAVAATITKPL